MTRAFPQLQNARLLVVGDAMLDRYWFGSVDRISPEAPVPVMAVGRVEERAGGAANVAMNIAAVGARCTLVCAAGNDDAARALDTTLIDNGVATRMAISESMPTTVKLRCIAQNQQLLRADFESPVDAATSKEMLRTAVGILGDVDVMVLSDYGKGGLHNAPELIHEARACGVPVVVDPKGTDFERYAGATMITPNQKEFEAVAGVCASDEVMRERATRLINELNLDSLMVTRSEKGIAWFTRDGVDYSSPARAREVYDVSGAGDTVIAVIASLMAAKISGEEALVLANAAAGVVVSRLGTAAVTVADIDAALQRDPQ